MQLIPVNYKKGGFEYALNFRDNLIAIYAQIDPETGKRIAFEVMEIIQAPAGEVFGKLLPEREVLPGTNQWGSKAFTVYTLEQAIAKKDEMRERIQANRQEKAA